MKVMKIGKLPKKTDLTIFYASNKNKTAVKDKLKNKKKNSVLSNYKSISNQKTQNHNCEYKSEIKKINLTIN
jgi:hypothetical protein